MKYADERAKRIAEAKKRKNETPPILSSIDTLGGVSIKGEESHYDISSNSRLVVVVSYPPTLSDL